MRLSLPPLGPNPKTDMLPAARLVEEHRSAKFHQTRAAAPVAPSKAAPSLPSAPSSPPSARLWMRLALPQPPTSKAVEPSAAQPQVERFSAMYRQLYGDGVGTGDTVMSAARVTNMILLVLTGVPSELFPLDTARDRFRPIPSAVHPRITGLSRAALAHTLEDVRAAGTHFRRLGALADAWMAPNAPNGQVWAAGLVVVVVVVAGTAPTLTPAPRCVNPSDGAGLCTSPDCIPCGT